MPEIVGHQFAAYEFQEWPKWVGDGDKAKLCGNETEARAALGLPSVEEEEAVAERAAADKVRADADAKLAAAEAARVVPAVSPEPFVMVLPQASVSGGMASVSGAARSEPEAD